MSITIQTQDSDGGVVIFANPACPPVARDGHTIREVDAIPAGSGELRWDAASGALVRFVAPPTPQQSFDAAVAAGYTVPDVTPAFVLPMDDAPRNLLHQLSYQLFTMNAVGRIQPGDVFPITDQSGNTRTFSYANVQTMIMGLGETYLSLYATLKTSTSP